MITLKVYDTVLEAKNNAVDDYRNYVTKEYIIREIDVKFDTAHPYKIKVNDDCYIYAINNPRYLRGMRVNKIEDYTRSGVCDEIRACEYESKN